MGLKLKIKKTETEESTSAGTDRDEPAWIETCSRWQRMEVPSRVAQVNEAFQYSEPQVQR
jgi:hypothetical protein